MQVRETLASASLERQSRLSLNRLKDKETAKLRRRRLLYIYFSLQISSFAVNAASSARRSRFRELFALLQLFLLDGNARR